jgi:hypothetical protein
VFAKPKEIYIKIQKEREEGAVKQAGPANRRQFEKERQRISSKV